MGALYVGGKRGKEDVCGRPKGINCMWGRRGGWREMGGVGFVTEGGKRGCRDE